MFSKTLVQICPHTKHQEDMVVPALKEFTIRLGYWVEEAIWDQHAKKIIMIVVFGGIPQELLWQISISKYGETTWANPMVTAKIWRLRTYHLIKGGGGSIVCLEGLHHQILRIDIIIALIRALQIYWCC